MACWNCRLQSLEWDDSRYRFWVVPTYVSCRCSSSGRHYGGAQPTEATGHTPTHTTLTRPSPFFADRTSRGWRRGSCSPAENICSRGFHASSARGRRHSVSLPTGCTAQTNYRYSGNCQQFATRQPTATHQGGPFENVTLSRPACSSRHRTSSRLKRFSSLVPNRSSASLRMA